MKVHSFFYKGLQIVSVLTLGLIFVLNFFFNATVGYDTSEIVSINPHLFKSAFFLLIIISVLFVLTFLKRYLEKIKEQYLFIAFSIIYVAMGIYLFYNVDSPLRADPLMVSQAAKDMLAGEYPMFEKGGYMHQYPHQIGLMLYDALLYCFCENVIINFFANLALVIGINYLSYKISDLIFENRLVNQITIIMSFAFLPQFFFTLFAYGNIPGFFFILFAFYHTIRFSKNHSIVSLICIVSGACFSVMLRKNFIIGVAAILIYLALNMLKNFSIKHIILSICIIISMILPLKILPLAFIGESSGMPSVLWLAMGTDIDNNVRAAGWYDDSNNEIFIESNYDAELAKEKGMEKLHQNAKKMLNDPLRTGKFFINKTISQWCNPLYQSLWVGPLKNCNQNTYTPLLTSLYTGGDEEKALSNLSKIYMIAFFGLALIFVIRYHKKYEGWELFFLMLIGGFLFHTIWEGKSQYVYSYFFSLVPFAAFSAARIITKFKEPMKKEE